MFCREKGCQVPICVSCMTTSHNKHDVIDLADAEEALVQRVETLRELLSNNADTLLQTKEDVRVKTKLTVDELQKQLDEVKKQHEKLDGMIKEAEENMEDANKRIDDDVTTINENIRLLDEMKTNMAAEKETKLKNLGEGHKTITEIIGLLDDNILGAKTFKYSTLKEDKNSLEEGETSIFLPRSSSDLGIPIAMELQLPELPISLTKDLSKLECSGTDH